MPIKGLKGGAGVKPLGYGLGAAEEATDPNFNQTILLLHADGSEGAGNTSALGSPNYKAFKDNSTSAHAITVEGDAYGNDFSPYYYADGYWSVFLSTNTSRIYTASSSDFDLGTSNFCYEGWIWADNPGALNYSRFFGLGPYYNDANSFGVAIADQDVSDYITVYWHNGTSLGRHLSSTTTLPAKQWNHIAVVRDGSNFALFLNGTRIATYSSSSAIGSGNRIAFVGHTGNGSEGYIGYFSNVRLVKGSSVYDPTQTSLTVPTSPLTAITNTVFLVGQSNRFIDNSSSAHSLSIESVPEVSTNTPFTQSKTANVGSGFFDGNDDVIYALETGSEFTYGTGDFEFSCWVYRTVDGVQQTLFGRNSTGDVLVPYIYITSGDNLAIYFTSSVNFATSTDVPKNAWCHLVVSKVSGTIKFFQDGVEVGSVGNSSTLIASGKVAIGNQWSGGTANAFTGYIADARVRKGYGVTSVTVPTTTVTAETGTELLTCQYSGAVRNVGFVDDSKYNHRISRNGDVSLGTFSPFSGAEGYWSVFFDGVDDELNLTNTATIGTGNFTMEMWVYPQNNSNSCLIDSRSANGATDGIIFKLNGGKFQISGLNGTTDIPLNEWTHLAVVREGTGTNETKMYVNGALEKTISFSLNLSSTFFGVGVFNDGGNSGPYKGYISNLRVVNDTVYTDTFTVPSTPLTAISNTDVLICQSNKFVDNSTNGFAITLPQGTAKIKPFSPFAPSRSYTKDAVGGSAFFDSGKIAFDPRAFDTIRDGDFTIEFWWYPVGGLTGYPGLFSMGIGGGYGNIINIGVTSNNALTGSLVSGYSADFTTPNNSYLDFQWHHIVLTRSGSGSNNCAFYINGVRTNQFTDTGDIGTGATVAYLGSQWFSSTRYAKGFYSSFRATNNAVYDITSATLTVPSAPLSNTANTLALTKFDNAGIIDHTMKNILLGVGDTRITTTDKKIGTGSLVFDGTDYLQAVNTEPRELFTPNGGDMTWEMFVKFDILDGLHTLFSKYGSGSEYQFYYDNGNTDWRLVYHTSTYTWDDNSIVTGTWYHIALVKDGTTHYLFKNGTSLGTNTATENTTLTGRNFALGTTFNGPNSALYQLKGKLDEIRVTRVARYTSTFTAPTKSYPNK